MLNFAYLNKISYHYLTKQNQETMNTTKTIALSVAVLAQANALTIQSKLESQVQTEIDWGSITSVFTEPIEIFVEETGNLVNDVVQWSSDAATVAANYVAVGASSVV